MENCHPVALVCESISPVSLIENLPQIAPILFCQALKPHSMPNMGDKQ